jgi:hypothetical protein
MAGMHGLAGRQPVAWLTGDRRLWMNGEHVAWSAIDHVSIGARSDDASVPVTFHLAQQGRQVRRSLSLVLAVRYAYIALVVCQTLLEVFIVYRVGWRLDTLAGAIDVASPRLSLGLYLTLWAHAKGAIQGRTVSTLAIAAQEGFDVVHCLAEHATIHDYHGATVAGSG